MSEVEVDVNGAVHSTFTDVSLPLHLSSDTEGRVIVADYRNHRILLLDQQLRLQQVLADRSSSVKLWRPQRLHYQEHTAQLYVAHSSERGMLSPDVISLLTVR